MKIEKIYAIAFMLLFALAVMPFAFATEDVAPTDADPVNAVPTLDSTVDVEITEEEVEPFYNTYGIEVRFLQLEEAILKSIQGQKRIVEYIEGNYPDVNTSELVSVIEKLSEVLDKTQNIDFTVDSEEHISIYSNLKEEAKELITLFRGLSHEIVNEGEILQLRERVRNIETNETINLSQRIREKKMKYNADQVKAVLNRLGINNSNLIASVESGEANYGNIRSEVAKMFGELDQEAKKQAILKMREAKTKLEVQKDAVMQRLRSSNLSSIGNRVRAELSNSGAVRLRQPTSASNGVNN